MTSNAAIVIRSVNVQRSEYSYTCLIEEICLGEYLILKTFPTVDSELKEFKRKNGREWHTEEDWNIKNQQATSMFMIAVQQHPTLQNAVLTANDVYGQAVGHIEQEVPGGCRHLCRQLTNFRV